MRSLAVGKLAAAYALNEVATSVAAMQSASALEDVAAKVLQTSPNDLDATYIHFFHERIPSRKLAESTEMDRLNILVTARPLDAHLLRTRATVYNFKSDTAAAIRDLTSAISLVKYHPGHINGRSLESQLLFMRGESYLTLAIRALSSALTPQGREDGIKKVRGHARRSVKDLNKFCAGLTFSDGLASETIRSIAELLTPTAKPMLAISDAPRRPAAKNLDELPQSPSTIEKVSEAFDARKSSTSIGDDTDAEMGRNQNKPVVTYHPLLPDALYSLLLSHILASTPSAELRRYAEQVYKLSRIVDGYPVFLGPKSSARQDWIEVVTRCGLDLIGRETWESQREGDMDGIGGEVREYPLSSNRAAAICKWIEEGLGGGRKTSIEREEQLEEGLVAAQDGNKTKVIKDGSITKGKVGLIDTN